jgi:predicted small lipoprotein YifL
MSARMTSGRTGLAAAALVILAACGSATPHEPPESDPDDAAVERAPTPGTPTPSEVEEAGDEPQPMPGAIRPDAEEETQARPDETERDDGQDAPPQR